MAMFSGAPVRRLLVRLGRNLHPQMVTSAKPAKFYRISHVADLSATFLLVLLSHLRTPVPPESASSISRLNQF